MEMPQSRRELEEHLAEQLRFLARSADAFDRGLEDEAKRLAVVLRVLLHDTAKSRSLLGQIGRKSGLFLDTSTPVVPGSLTSYHGLVALSFAPGREARYVPFLSDTADPPREVPFEDWWTAPVSIDSAGDTLTRGQLVCAVANKDGGAHVDPELDGAYAQLTRLHSMGVVAFGPTGEHPIGPPHLATVRQIAHEVLKTLVPGYSKVVKREGALVANLVVQAVRGQPGPPNLPGSRQQRPMGSKKVGRNDPCICGSGRKFKRCCGR